MNSDAKNSAGSVALFVFIPFCRIKCTYCDFNAYANMARLMSPYSGAIAREIDLVASGLNGEKRARTIYLGGGTPSLVQVDQIERILASLNDNFSVEPGAEITLEANPGTVDRQKLSALRKLGINRLSLGVQSFDEATVRRLNRGHTVAEAVESFCLARESGFENINLDLIYGLPLQTEQDWRYSLERALALSPEHLSLYALKVEEGTGLKFQIEKNKYPPPDDDLAADMFTIAEETLDAAGYDHYEISNWARRSASDLFKSLHNMTYWLNEPYLGFGAGAHSSFGGDRFWNVLAPKEYIDRVERGESAVEGCENINRELEIAETMILGLRLGEGVKFARIRRRFGIDPIERFGSVLRECEGMGLVELDEESVRLTARGRLLSNQVFYRLLPD